MNGIVLFPPSRCGTIPEALGGLNVRLLLSPDTDAGGNSQKIPFSS